MSISWLGIRSDFDLVVRLLAARRLMSLRVQLRQASTALFDNQFSLSQSPKVAVVVCWLLSVLALRHLRTNGSIAQLIGRHDEDLLGTNFEENRSLKPERTK
jgi:hypothetical protein